jgi:uncharacterized protein YndB with AHSA1/START domain
MWTSEVGIDIKAPAADVYRYLADFGRHREWSSATMTRLDQLNEGPVGVGSEFEAAETVPARVVTRSRITALEPNGRIAWHARFGKLMAVDWELLISERDGITHLVQRSAWQPGNPLMELYHRLVRRGQIPVENRHSLERIKAALEKQVLVS